MDITKKQLKDMIASSIKQQIVAREKVNESKTRLTRDELKGMVKQMMASVLSEGGLPEPPEEVVPGGMAGFGTSDEEGAEAEEKEQGNWNAFLVKQFKKEFGEDMTSYEGLPRKERMAFLKRAKAKFDGGMNEGQDMCEDCGKAHTDMDECGVARGITTVMDEAKDKDDDDDDSDDKDDKKGGFVPFTKKDGGKKGGKKDDDDCDDDDSDDDEDKDEVTVESFRRIIRKMIIEESADLKKKLNEPLDEQFFDKVKQAVGGKIDQHRAKSQFKDNIGELISDFFESAWVLQQRLDKDRYIDAIHGVPEDGQKYIEVILHYLNKAKQAWRGLEDGYAKLYPNRENFREEIYKWSEKFLDIDASKVTDTIGWFHEARRYEEEFKKKHKELGTDYKLANEAKNLESFVSSTISNLLKNKGLSEQNYVVARWVDKHQGGPGYRIKHVIRPNGVGDAALIGSLVKEKDFEDIFGRNAKAYANFDDIPKRVRDSWGRVNEIFGFGKKKSEPEVELSADEQFREELEKAYYDYKMEGQNFGSFRQYIGHGPTRDVVNDLSTLFGIAHEDGGDEAMHKLGLDFIESTGRRSKKLGYDWIVQNGLEKYFHPGVLDVLKSITK